MHPEDSLQLTPLNLDDVRIDVQLARRLPPAVAMRQRVLLFGRDGNRIVAACPDPTDYATLETVERLVGQPVKAVPADLASLGRALSRVFPTRDDAESDEAVRLVNDLIEAALIERASDIHLEPRTEGLRVRFRVDGVLETVRVLPSALASVATNRVKILSGMDISEKRVPQDGRFQHAVGSGSNRWTVDVRVAALPTRFGERLTLRLLSRQTADRALTDLGLSEDDLAIFRAAIDQPQGLILLTGPTGSGKTTTLYAALRELDVEAMNVLTIEDPVEYDIADVSQVEVDSSDRVSFSRALRSALRHDPDVLMIGEIRDLETAEVAIRASLTGHLVLSTLHTSSSVGAVTRLVDMGIPPYLVAATLRLTVAQRLVRQLCRACRRPRRLVAEEAARLGHVDAAGRTVYDAAGCANCKNTGFSGRIGVFESLPIDDALRRDIAAGRNEDELRNGLESRGTFRPLRRDAAMKILSGWTTPREAAQVVEGT